LVPWTHPPKAERPEIPGRFVLHFYTTGLKTIALLRPAKAASRVLDAFERLLWWLFAGSAGAKTRALVISAVREEPRNAQQLSEALGLDYTTVRHHLKVMEENRLVVTEGSSYGKLYFVSDSMEAHWQSLQSILQRVRSKK
jgi:DNA-binding transcriptional ArsR family regulator